MPNITDIFQMKKNILKVSVSKWEKLSMDKMIIENPGQFEC